MKVPADETLQAARFSSKNIPALGCGDVAFTKLDQGVENKHHQAHAQGAALTMVVPKKG